MRKLEISENERDKHDKTPFPIFFLIFFFKNQRQASVFNFLSSILTKQFRP
jgi:hypothetical protein